MTKATTPSVFLKLVSKSMFYLWQKMLWNSPTASLAKCTNAGKLAFSTSSKSQDTFKWSPFCIYFIRINLVLEISPEGGLLLSITYKIKLLSSTYCWSLLWQIKIYIFSSLDSSALQIRKGHVVLWKLSDISVQHIYVLLTLH